MKLSIDHQFFCLCYPAIHSLERDPTWPLCNVCFFLHSPTGPCAGGLIVATKGMWAPSSPAYCVKCHLHHPPIDDCPEKAVVYSTPRCALCHICHDLEECPTPCTSALPCSMKPYSTENWVCAECLNSALAGPPGTWNIPIIPEPVPRKFISIHL